MNFDKPIFIHRTGISLLIDGELLQEELCGYSEKKKNCCKKYKRKGKHCSGCPKK